MLYYLEGKAPGGFIFDLIMSRVCIRVEEVPFVCSSFLSLGIFWKMSS